MCVWGGGVAGRGMSNREHDKLSCLLSARFTNKFDVIKF